MKPRSRIVLLLASLLLVVPFFSPIWKITLDAPQYPEGLGMYIEIDNIRGESPNDLKNINGLNHYIGMKQIVPDSIPELRWMPWIIGFLAATGLLAAAVGRRGGLYAWTAVFALVAVVGLVDFYAWEYDYGHNLDLENAAIKIPGMSYQPPLIGSKKLLNFTAQSWPAIGGWAVFVSLAAAIVLSVSAFRNRRNRVPVMGAERTRATAPGSRKTGAVVVASALLAWGCTSGPSPIHYGADACSHCKMVIADARFATELVSDKGKVLKFDAIECAAAFAADAGSGRYEAWVHEPGELSTWVRARDVSFVRSESIHSPMGAGLGVWAGDSSVLPVGVHRLTWDEVVASFGKHEHGVVQ